jgi:hypothetical protein
VNCLPSLPTHNYFDVLSIESNETIETIDKIVQDPEPSSPPTLTSLFHPKSCLKWERRLPSKFVIADTEGKTNFLKLKVELETMDTAEIKSANALVDCGATGEFIDRHYAKSSQFHLLKLSKPIPVFNIDGTPNKDRAVMEVVDLILWYKTHSKWTLFAVSNLEKQKLILRHSWLQNIIQKLTGRLEISRCPAVYPDAVLAVKKMHSKSRLPIKLRSIERRPAPVVLYLSSIMT